MKYYRISLVLLTAMLFILVLSGTVGATVREDIRFKAAEPTFGLPCDEPPDLGFDPIGLPYSEKLKLKSLEDEDIGTGFLCHFVKSEEVNEYGVTQVNFTSGTFSFSDGSGSVAFIGETRYMSLPNSSIRVKLRGNITGGSETFDGVEGKVEAGGKVTFNEEGNLIPDVTFVLHLK